MGSDFIAMLQKAFPIRELKEKPFTLSPRYRFCYILEMEGTINPTDFTFISSLLYLDFYPQWESSHSFMYSSKGRFSMSA